MFAGLMLGSFVSGRLSHHRSPEYIVSAGFAVLATGVVSNLVQETLFDATILLTIGPLVIYAIGTAIIMPAITMLALDDLPYHRGTAASMQGFFQISINAGVAGIAVPILHTQLMIPQGFASAMPLIDPPTCGPAVTMEARQSGRGD
jgi:DHA1 family bicyclomycin/chloramphenicol resistance-like MFS transporter